MPTLPQPRDCIAALTPYASARRSGPAEGDVWLNANEGNAWLGKATLDARNFNRYPEFQDPDLIGDYANYLDVSPTWVLATRGADEGIDLVIRCFCEPSHERILIAPPTYGMYAIAAETLGVEVVRLERELGEAIVPDALIALAREKEVKVVFLCSPNNPSGETIPQDHIAKIAEALPQTVIVVDEAYIEFARPDSSVQPLIDRFSNVVMLRTLSKAFGLAGIRVGFAVAQKEMIGVLAKALAPYPIPRPSALIAQQSLREEGVLAMRQRVRQANQEKQQLTAQLRESSEVVRVLPSSANFLTFEAHDPAAFLRRCSEYSLVIRDFSKRARMKNVLRVSIGSSEECALFARVLAEGAKNE